MLLLACPENSIVFLWIVLRTMLELLILPVKLEVVEKLTFFFLFPIVFLAFGNLVLIAGFMATLVAIGWCWFPRPVQPKPIHVDYTPKQHTLIFRFPPVLVRMMFLSEGLLITKPSYCDTARAVKTNKLLLAGFPYLIWLSDNASLQMLLKMCSRPFLFLLFIRIFYLSQFHSFLGTVKHAGWRGPSCVGECVFIMTLLGLCSHWALFINLAAAVVVLGSSLVFTCIRRRCRVALPLAWYWDEQCLAFRNRQPWTLGLSSVRNHPVLYLQNKYHLSGVKPRCLYFIVWASF